MNIYATPYQVREQIDKESRIDDAVLLRALVGASRLIDEASGRFFFPMRQVITLNPPTGGRVLWLPKPLLVVESVELAEGWNGAFDESLAVGDYWLSDGVTDATPYQEIEIGRSGSVAGWGSAPWSVRVTGVWGWRREYATAWAAVDAVQNNPLTAGATSMTVVDADGVDEWGVAKRLQVGQVVRLGSEFVFVASVNETTNTVGIVRGQNGTTAAQHAQLTAVEVWRPEPLVVQATIVQASRTFKRGLQGFEDAAASAELGRVTYTKRIDPDVQAMLYDAGLRRVTV